jgi:hypothetical protein
LPLLLHARGACAPELVEVLLILVCLVLVLRSHFLLLVIAGLRSAGA